MTVEPCQVPRKCLLPQTHPVPFPHPRRRTWPAKSPHKLSARRPSLCRGRLSGAMAGPRRCKRDLSPQAAPAACSPCLAAASGHQAHRAGWQGHRDAGSLGFLSWCCRARPRWKRWAGRSFPSLLRSRCVAPAPWYPCCHQLMSQRDDVTRVRCTAGMLLGSGLSPWDLWGAWPAQWDPQPGLEGVPWWGEQCRAQAVCAPREPPAASWVPG